MDTKGDEDISNLKTSLTMVEGVADVCVSHSDGVIEVEFDASSVGARKILQTIQVSL